MKNIILATLSFIVIITNSSFAFTQGAPQSNSQGESGEPLIDKPNILWLFQEDLSPWLGCYGYEIQQGQTPNIDALAKRGVRFSRAFVPAPVCSACRSAIMTGANQIRFGAHEHRSRRGEASLPLPAGMKTIAELMTESGYFCFNVGKTDYNFEHDTVFPKIPKSNNKTPWRARPDGQPFFGQIQLRGGKINTKKFKSKCDRSKVTIPADYPQNDLYREVVAEHFDSARMDDQVIGNILQRLKKDGLLDSTIIVYFSDHGANNLVRHKQQPTEGGSHVPFIIAGPEPFVPDTTVRNDLVSMLDLSATTLSWAGVPHPEWMEGKDLFAKEFQPREFVGTARDRCDHSIDRIRSIRTDRFRYTRNFMRDRVLLQAQYRDNKNYLRYLRDSYADGTLDPKLAKIYFGERPSEELYDVNNDPAQLNNLVDDPQFAEELKRHRKLMEGWLAAGDTGEGDEPETELRMASNKKWGLGVNVEFEAIRTDSDGDGLSDEWEKINGRDPVDGRLMFTFDCSGWQTEGWQSDGKTDNIAGRLGYLDFELLEGRAVLSRDRLRLDANKNMGIIELTMKSSHKMQVNLFANDVLLGRATLNPIDQFSTIEIPQDKITEGTIESLRMEFDSDAGTIIEIDGIQHVVREN